MPLDIRLAAAAGEPPSAATAGPSFDDDANGGHYWFLYPLFERLAETTGQHIDLYGYAEFRGDDLASLWQTLAEARRLAEAQPERWPVHVGTAGMPNTAPPVPPWEVFKEVRRPELLALIDDFIDVVERANATGRPVVCVGD